jgi:type II secretory pathway pseudopilin PulG
MKISLLHLKLVRRESPRGAFPFALGFTLIEIALCLAIIGFALLAVMIVLPYGMNTQRDNREETVIGQDAGVLLELIRNGSRGADDLTNYVYAVTNYWSWTNYLTQQSARGVNGYTFQEFSVPNNTPYVPGAPITNGANIIGLISTPEFTDSNGNPIRKLDPAFVNSGYSNHIVAYVRSISGLAAEKPTQKNAIMVEDSFTYRLYAVNAAQDFDVPAIWLASQNYNAGDVVAYYYQGTATYWRANAATTVADVPSVSSKWVQFTYYNHVLAGSQRELRLTFRWPQLPNGNIGSGRQIFRASVPQETGTRNYSPVGQLLYFYQPQYFSPAP